MKKPLIIIAVIVGIILLVLTVKYFMCKNKQAKTLNAASTNRDSTSNPVILPVDNLLNAAKPCKFFSLK